MRRVSCAWNNNNGPLCAGISPASSAPSLSFSPTAVAVAAADAAPNEDSARLAPRPPRSLLAAATRPFFPFWRGKRATARIPTFAPFASAGGRTRVPRAMAFVRPTSCRGGGRTCCASGTRATEAAAVRIEQEGARAQRRNNRSAPPRSRGPFLSLFSLFLPSSSAPSTSVCALHTDRKAFPTRAAPPLQRKESKSHCTRCFHSLLSPCVSVASEILSGRRPCPPTVAAPAAHRLVRRPAPAPHAARPRHAPRAERARRHGDALSFWGRAKREATPLPCNPRGTPPFSPLHCISPSIPQLPGSNATIGCMISISTRTPTHTPQRVLGATHGGFFRLSCRIRKVSPGSAC